VNLNRKYCILQKLITSNTQPTEIAASVSIYFARALLKQSQPLPWGSGFRCDNGEVTILRNQFLKPVALAAAPAAAAPRTDEEKIVFTVVIEIRNAS